MSIGSPFALLSIHRRPWRIRDVARRRLQKWRFWAAGPPLAEARRRSDNSAVASCSRPYNALATGSGGVWHTNREEAFHVFQATSWSWMAIVVILVAGGWLILRIRARFRDREDPAVEGRGMLMQMGELHREGGLSDEEYRSIKNRLGGPSDHSLRGTEPENDHGVETDSP